jgi:hypothetical protein
MAWAPDYVNAVETKDFLRLDDNVDNVFLAMAITTSSRAVDDHCRRQFGLVDAPEARRYRVEWDRHRYRYFVTIDDLMTVTGFTVTINGDVFTSSDYRLEPINNVTKGKPWTELVLLRLPSLPPPHAGFLDEIFVDLVGQWGWTTIPTQVKLASLMQTNRFLARRYSPFGVAGSPSDGSEIRLQAKLDPDVSTALGSNLVRW